MSQDLLVTLEYKKPNAFLKFLLWAVGIFFLIIVSILFYLNYQSNKLIKTFSSGANISKEEFFKQSNHLLSSFQSNYEKVDELPKKYNFLILGTDKLSGREGDPELTDTILLLQVDLEDGQINTISLPRDLYNSDYQSKINALYFYGQERYPDNPIKFPKEVIEEMTGLKIDFALAIGIEDLEKLIDLAGGIDINVPMAFRDESFPIPGVEVSKVRDPKLLYETISFSEGSQKMNSTTALKYMRSRYSESDEGTDMARAARQQLVLEALASKLSQIRDPFLIGQLYRFYLDQFAKYIPPEDIGKLASVYLNYIEKKQNPNLIFNKYQVTIYPNDDSGVIYNPPLWQTNQQWVYQIKDQRAFEESIDDIFN